MNRFYLFALLIGLASGGFYASAQEPVAEDNSAQSLPAAVLPFGQLAQEGAATNAPLPLGWEPLEAQSNLPALPFLPADEKTQIPGQPPFASGAPSPFARALDGALPLTNAAADAVDSEADKSSEEDEDSAVLPAAPGTDPADILVGLKYENMDVEEVLKQYSDWTGLALMRAPDVPSVKITLKCPRRLPKREALLAIEGVLAMHGIALVPMGDKFLKVVQISSARQSGMITGTGAVEKDIADTDHLVSRIVVLKHIEIAEAQGIIQNLMHPYGKIMPLDRINSLLITESALNLTRILEILAIVDQPIETREELRIFPISHAKASEIQSKIEAIIADVQTKDSASRLRQQLAATRMPRQLLQALQPGQPAPASPLQPTVTDQSANLERGLIQSKVKIVADDRINALIVITRSEQFPFFENIIKALDQQVEPNITIRVFSLEYADSKDVVTVLNNLIGAAGTKSGENKPLLPGADQKAAPPPATTGRDTSAPKSGEIQLEGKMSSDVKIIADTRINSLLVMASRADMAVIEDLLKQVDIMLSQVLIEVVIVEIGLGDQIKMGIDWLQRSMIAYNNKQGGGRRAFAGFAGTSRMMGDGDASLKDGTTINRISDSPAGAGSGLSYYFTLFDFNLDAVINMLASSSEAKILSAPIILTTDNKEAKIMVGEKRPIVTSTSISGGGVQQSAYQYTDIGIQLEVTPHINKKGFVVMDIKQKIDNKGDDVIIDGNKVPVITTRDFTASIAVNDGRTIVIGGIVTSDSNKGRNKIPFLGDIPLLGFLFRSDSKEQVRRELIVLITPYVLDTPEKAYAETARRHGQISEASNLWTTGWSASTLAAPTAQQRKEEQRKARSASGAKANARFDQTPGPENDVLAPEGKPPK